MNIKVSVQYLKTEHTKNDEIRRFVDPLSGYYPNFDKWFREKCCKERRLAIVARNEIGVIIGAAILKKKDNKISSFYIAHDYRCQGVGTAMMKVITKILNLNKKIRIYPLKQHMEAFRKLFEKSGLFYYSNFNNFIDAMFDNKIESFISVDNDVVLWRPNINIKQSIVLYEYNEECYNYEIVSTRELFTAIKDNTVKVNMVDMNRKSYTSLMGIHSHIKKTELTDMSGAFINCKSM